MKAMKIALVFLIAFGASGCASTQTLAPLSATHAATVSIRGFGDARLIEYAPATQLSAPVAVQIERFLNDRSNRFGPPIFELPVPAIKLELSSAGTPVHVGVGRNYLIRDGKLRILFERELEELLDLLDIENVCERDPASCRDVGLLD